MQEYIRTDSNLLLSSQTDKLKHYKKNQNNPWLLIPIIVSFHFIIQIFYDCIFTKKLVTLNYKNIQKRISQKDGKTLFWHRKLFDGLVKG